MGRVEDAEIGRTADEGEGEQDAACEVVDHEDEES